MQAAFFIVFALIVVVAALLFSIAQAWALADEDIRVERMLLTAIAMAVLLTLGHFLVFLGRAPTPRDNSAWFAAAVSTCTTAVFFGIAWLRFGRAPGSAGPTIWRLFPVNLAVSFVLAAIEFAVFLLLALSNIH